MRTGSRSAGAVLLTLGFVTLALLVASLAIGPAGQAAAAPPHLAAAAPAPTGPPPGPAAGEAADGEATGGEAAGGEAAGGEAAGGEAVDTTPPTRPAGERPCPVPLAPSPTGYASICWNASSDDTGVVAYDLYRLDPDGFTRAATTTGTVGGFSGELGRAYTMYVVARDAAGNVSRPSGLITVTAVTGMSPTSTPTPPPGDRLPPSKPTGLRDACLQDYHGVTFCWQPSADNVAVTAYDVYRESATGYVKAGTLAASTFPNFAESGLVTGQRYTYVVVARDAAGNLSAPSDPLSALARPGLPSPTSSPGLECAVSYRAATWGPTLSAEITVRNTGTAVIDGWTLTLDYPEPAPRLVAGWSADWTQSGARFSGAARSWNKVLRPGSSTQVGFTASHTAPAPAPVSFTLNGRPCTAA
ncbi:cellulose binding domain-containing protein [Nonomuraea sp. NPDC049725]|uniref:cellulose binding domain-containing protein n=1 Tax=Nonomuraea sp. NPDC049725 TaxID=3154508 RepID=UPI00342ABC8A